MDTLVLEAEATEEAVAFDYDGVDSSILGNIPAEEMAPADPAGEIDHPPAGGVVDGGHLIEPFPGTSGERADSAEPGIQLPATTGTTECPPAQSITNTSDDAMEHYRIRKENAERRFLDCTMYERTVEARLKSAKHATKEAMELLEDIMARGPERLPLFDDDNGPAKESQREPDSMVLVEGPIDADMAKQVVESCAKIVDQNAWRNVPTTELHLETVPRMGKKIDIILSRFPTIGLLEDQRATFESLRGIEGVGEKLADGIEEKILEWLSKNRDFAELEAAREAVPASQPSDTAPPPDTAMSTSSPTGIAIHDPDARAAAQIVERAEELKAAGKITWTGGDEIFNEGRAAFSNQQRLTDCAWTAGDQQDSWIRGWLFEQVGTANEAAAKESDEPADERPAVQSEKAKLRKPPRKPKKAEAPAQPVAAKPEKKKTAKPSLKKAAAKAQKNLLK